MNTAPISDIIIAKRVREEYDAKLIEELACSIFTNGLFHAILVHDDEIGMVLRAGRTRLHAIGELYSCGLTFSYDGEPVPLGEVPYIYVNEQNIASALEIEMEENLRRQDFTWKEKVAGTARLHALYKEMAAATGTVWTATNTAEEIAKFEGKEYVNKKDISDTTAAIILEEFLNDPIIAAAKDPKQALKMVKTQKQHEKRQALKAQFDMTKANVTTMRLLHGRFEDLVKQEPDASIDVIITDPPYGKDIHTWTSWDGESHDYDDSEDYFNSLLPIIAAESFRIAKPEAHLYMFHDLPYFDRILAALTIAGWRVWSYPLIWDKGNTGSFGDHNHGPRHCYEAILYAIKGEKETKEMRKDVLQYTQPTQTIHPAQKPVGLYIDLLQRSVNPGDKVIDFFAGKGTVFEAAHAVNCFATGIELSDKYHAMCIETIVNLKGV